MTRKENGPTVAPVPDEAQKVVVRYDRGQVAKVSRDDNGFLYVDATVTRVGVFHYQRADGSVRRELRPPEEVFDQKHLNTIRRAVVTTEHPGRVTPKNVQSLQVGHADSNVRVRELYVDVGLTLTDDKAIADVEKRERTDCSLGYRCRLDHVSGVWKGIDGKAPPEPYDAIQRGLVVNHIALTVEGRASQGGHEVGLHLDSNDAVQVDRPNQGTNQVVKLNVDGAELELESGVATLVRAALEKRDSQLEDTKVRADSLEKERDGLQAKSDQLSEDLEKEKSSRLDSSQVDTLVKERLSVLTQAQKLLDKEEVEKLDSLTNTEVKVACLKKHTKADLEGRSEDYVSARFDALVESHGTSGHTRLAAGVVGAANTPEKNEERSSLDKRIADAQNRADARSRGKQEDK